MSTLRGLSRTKALVDPACLSPSDPTQPTASQCLHKSPAGILESKFMLHSSLQVTILRGPTIQMESSERLRGSRQKV